MDNKNTNHLFTWMQQFAVAAGAIALCYQPSVINKGKLSYDLAGSKESAAGRAKTIVDEMIQELFLAKLYERWPDVSINVEEDTPLVSLFKDAPSGKRSPLTIHLDPIDGTLAYINGSREFAVGLAISDAKNIFTHTVIYAPALKKLYAASPRRGVITLNSHVIHPALPKNPPRIIYEKRLLSKRGRRQLRSLGFSFAPLQSAHLAIINTSLRHAAAFLYAGSNPHDGMIPAAFARHFGITPCTIKGDSIDPTYLCFTRTRQFVSFERIPSLCYYSCSKEIQQQIQHVLSQKENLHMEYRARFMSHEK